MAHDHENLVAAQHAGVAVQVHVDAAEVRDGEITGGALVDVETWLLAGVPGFRATTAAIEGLAGY